MVKKLIVIARVFCRIVYDAPQLISVTARVFRRVEYGATQFATSFHDFNEVNEQKIVTNSH